ncbi:TetR/AcrR family transcriptional regulator [Streptomyces durmitorensis]|uniref:TetR/AcrR family transcriptional regulator n=1 Tax=Streptomyces durmitorensis TaxID=319947 RepID=A0ABY4Q6F7_9ACTN|nr:TetR/AcrR family transcriptional regulator [Streptomyces durmitorensis]UQT61297.1 TetR/AcrR family transcriptional regulator [Streptomyces durmitorensis]
MTEPPRRRLRADARRNRDRLLAEADAVFRQEGTDAPLDSVARRAGVAIGTLYGHFPNRRALVGSLLRERNQALFQHGQELLTSSPPAQALIRWVYAVVEHAAAYQGLAAVLADGLGDQESELHASCVRMTDISDQLIANARAVGALRRDVTGADIFALMNAAAWTREHLPLEQADRLVALTMDGMLTRAPNRNTTTKQDRSQNS